MTRQEGKKGCLRSKPALERGTELQGEGRECSAMRHLDSVFSSTVPIDARCTPRHSRCVSQLTPLPLCFVFFKTL